MSKEKLQSIRDKYAKENYDNGESHATCWQELVDNDLSFDNEDVVELMKLAYNQALYDSGESVFNMTAYTHRSQDYQHGWEDCQIEAQRKIKKLKI